MTGMTGMTGYACKDCGQPVLVTPEVTIRTCAHQTTIVACMDGRASGTATVSHG